MGTSAKATLTGVAEVDALVDSDVPCGVAAAWDAHCPCIDVTDPAAEVPPAGMEPAADAPANVPDTVGAAGDALAGNRDAPDTGANVLDELNVV